MYTSGYFLSTSLKNSLSQGAFFSSWPTFERFFTTLLTCWIEHKQAGAQAFLVKCPECIFRVRYKLLTVLSNWYYTPKSCLVIHENVIALHSSGILIILWFMRTQCAHSGNIIFFFFYSRNLCNLGFHIWHKHKTTAESLCCWWWETMTHLKHNVNSSSSAPIKY